MRGMPKLSQMDGLSGNQFIYREFSFLWGAENGVIVRINSLGNPKIYTALAHSLKIAKKAFVLCEKKTRKLSVC